MNTSPASPSYRVVILGGTSTIAEATCRLLAERGASIALLGRREDRLQEIATDLSVRGAAQVLTHTVDLAHHQDKATKLQQVSEELGGIDAVLAFYGTLGNQEEANGHSIVLDDILTSNFTSVVQWINDAVPLLQKSKAKRPVAMAISSVAGDRGRRSNYAYGAAKGGLSIFMQGLAHRLAAEGPVHAINMKLGFVKSDMTAHLDTDGPLWADPKDVAKSIVRALDKGGPIVYAPWFWRWIMLAIRVTPAMIFNKVNL